MRRHGRRHYNPISISTGRVAMRIGDELVEWLGHVLDRATGSLRA